MYQEMLAFLRTKRVGVISVEMLDGSPHGAAVHFAHTEKPLAFIFLTDRKYRKSEPLLNRGITRASLVIGSSEDEMKSLQIDGEAALSEDQELKKIYFSKFPDKLGKYQGPDDIFFTFTPTWWRYTDWRKPEGKVILTSDGKIEVVKS